MSYQHAIVWIDHQHATVIDFSVDDQHVQLVEREGGPVKVHRKSGIPGPGKAGDDPKFHDAVVEAVGNAREVLVVGPGNAKLAFRKDLDHRHAAVAKRVVGVESADHPSNGQLLAFAKQYFKKYDALQG
ncbi:MAG TPA: translational machinery protein [Acidimicrobiaceae bacterium]|nr:translational machinery protein [Acidimicrobiaceae bacterium]